MKTRGFTLVELVMVIMITGIIAASFTVFFRPAIDGYFDTRRRADLTDIADTALRRMSQDIRRAVPNSIRPAPGSTTCFQLVPTIAGGRYRMASDIDNDTPPLPCEPGVACSAPLDTSGPTEVFDVLSPLEPVPEVGDWIVINNQNTNDVYTKANLNTIIKVQTASVPTDNLRATDGLHRITINLKQFSSGYDGGRFVAVDRNEQTVFYSCIGRTLYRTVAAFDADPASTCASTSGAILATDINSCTFVHNPDQGRGGTQQSGFVWMRIEVGRDDETIALTHGVHVSNMP